MDEIIEFSIVMGVTLALIVAVLAALFAVGLSVAKWECDGYENATGKNTFMSNGTCYVTVNDKVYSMSEHHARIVAEEGLKQ